VLLWLWLLFEADAVVVVRKDLVNAEMAGEVRSEATLETAATKPRLPTRVIDDDEECIIAIIIIIVAI